MNLKTACQEIQLGTVGVKRVDKWQESRHFSLESLLGLKKWHKYDAEERLWDALTREMRN